MACRLFGAMPLFEQMLAYCQLNPKNIHMYFDDILFDKITDILFKMKKKSAQFNAFENVVCKIASYSLVIIGLCNGIVSYSVLNHYLNRC